VCSAVTLLLAALLAMSLGGLMYLVLKDAPQVLQDAPQVLQDAPQLLPLFDPQGKGGGQGIKVRTACRKKLNGASGQAGVPTHPP
jgi:hypothetical protein